MGATQVASQPFYRGAEADLSLSLEYPWKAVVKHRISKKYRHSALDEKLMRERTLSESSIIHEAKKAGVHVPSIIKIDSESNTIVMTHVPGKVARETLDSMSRSQAKNFFRSLGNQVGKLHAAGIVHGDLTTSNIIVTSSGEPFIVDFGMSRRSIEPEDRGVDLHLLQRSITASHITSMVTLISSLIDGYREGAGEKLANSTWAKAREISRRGRYYAIR